MRRAFPIVIGLLLTTLVLAAGCGEAGQTAAGGTDSPPKAHSERSDAAPFSGVTLDGTQVSLGSFEGRPLVLIFWASW